MMGLLSFFSRDKRLEKFTREVVDVIEKAALNSTFLKQVLIDPQHALKDYKLSADDFNSVLLGIHHANSVMQLLFEKKKSNDIHINIKREHLRSGATMDMERLKKKPATDEYIRIMESVQALLLELNELKVSYDIKYTEGFDLTRRKLDREANMLIASPSCRHPLKVLNRAEGCDLLLNVRDFRELLPTLREIRHAGCCPECKGEIGAIMMVIFS